jgi:subfamily B ATP-binding cassette protein MsbA
MLTILHSFRDYRALWRLWSPLLLLTLFLPIVAVGMPLVERRLVDEVIVGRRLDLLPETIAIYAALWLFSTGGLVAGGAVSSYLSEQVALRLRLRLLSHYEALSLAFSSGQHSGRTMALFVNDVPVVAGLFSTTLAGVIGSVVTLGIAIAVMFSLSWQLAVAAGLLPPLVAGAAAMLARPLRPAARHAQDKAADLSEYLQEHFAGTREIVAFSRQRAQTLHLTKVLEELLHLRLRVTLMDTAVQTGQLLFSLSVTLVLLGYGGYLVIHGDTSLGVLVAMRSLFSVVFQPARQLGGLIVSMQKALGAADRVAEFLGQAPTVVERSRARNPEHISGEVVYENVSFAYQSGRPVLDNVSFSAGPGENVAIVGPSGAGKSTLASLLPRFRDPLGGRILLDGVDIRELTLDGLREQVGIVFQDTFLFASTIRENIALGKSGASEAEIIACARSANAWEFIQQLPDGLDTRVGERGVNLSEGQKQRLAIARALLRDPRVLILDEPTSALDARSESLVQDALQNLVRGRTTFVIAHRLSTVRTAHQILVLNGGHLVERGTHPQLLEREGLYRELFDLQFMRAA